MGKIFGLFHRCSMTSNLGQSGAESGDIGMKCNPS